MEPGALAEAVHQAFIEATRAVASVLPQGEAKTLGAWFVYDAGVNNPDFNLAAVDGDPFEAAREIGAVEEWFAQRGTGFSFRLRSTCDLPAVARLPAGAREPSRNEPFMALALDGWRPRAVPDGLAVGRAESDGQLDDYDRFDLERGRRREWSIASAVRRAEGCDLWLAYRRDEAVARAMAVARGPVGSIHNVVVAEQYRRRGYGRAVTEAAIDACAAGGCSHASLGATEVGLRLYSTMGFKVVYELTSFPAGARVRS